MHSFGLIFRHIKIDHNKPPSQSQVLFWMVENLLNSTIQQQIRHMTTQRTIHVHFYVKWATKAEIIVRMNSNPEPWRTLYRESWKLIIFRLKQIDLFIKFGFSIFGICVNLIKQNKIMSYLLRAPVQRQTLNPKISKVGRKPIMFTVSVKVFLS